MQKKRNELLNERALTSGTTTEPGWLSPDDRVVLQAFDSFLKFINADHFHTLNGLLGYIRFGNNCPGKAMLRRFFYPLLT